MENTNTFATDSKPRGKSSKSDCMPQELASPSRTPPPQSTDHNQDTKAQEPRFERQIPAKFSQNRRSPQRKHGKERVSSLNTQKKQLEQANLDSPSVDNSTQHSISNRTSPDQVPKVLERHNHSYSGHLDDKEDIKVAKKGEEGREREIEREREGVGNLERQRKDDKDNKGEYDVNEDEESIEDVEDEDDSEYEDDGDGAHDDDGDDDGTDSDTSLAEEVQQPPLPLMGGVSPVVERSSRKRRTAARTGTTSTFTYTMTPEKEENATSTPQLSQMFSPTAVIPDENTRGFFTIEGSESSQVEPATTYVDYSHSRASEYNVQFHRDTTTVGSNDFLRRDVPHNQGQKELRETNTVAGSSQEPNQPPPPLPPPSQPLDMTPMQSSSYYENLLYNNPRGVLYQGDPRLARLPGRQPPPPYTMPYIWGQAGIGAQNPDEARYQCRFGDSTTETPLSRSPNAGETTGNRGHNRKRRFNSPATSSGQNTRRSDKPTTKLESGASSPREAAPVNLISVPSDPPFFPSPSHTAPPGNSTGTPYSTTVSSSDALPVQPQVGPQGPPAPVEPFPHQAEGHQSPRSKPQQRKSHMSIAENKLQKEKENELSEDVRGNAEPARKYRAIWREGTDPIPFYSPQGQHQVPYVPVQPSYGGFYSPQVVPMYQGAATQQMQAQLEIDGDLAGVTKNWSVEEIKAGRRLVRFHREQNGVKIRLTFEPLDRDSFRDGMTAISCIWRRETQEYFVTSVDCITILELIMGQRFSIEEKNRTRRNLEACRPVTVSKNKPELEPFFRQIMSFDIPRPRNIEKDLKVFLWSNLESALKKIVSKYSAVDHQLQQPPP